MALKKTEIYSTLWASCNELRGGMDASQYKDYVLTMLFMKYVSDKYKDDAFGDIVVPEGGSFEDMVALKGDKEIGEKVDKIIAKLAEANGLRGVIDVADFNDEEKLGKGKEHIDRLSKLIGIFEGLDLSGNRADGDDLLGDAYEFLMRHFATESGKSKGQFYTPSEVSRILAKIIGVDDDTPQDATVYDPACGSGSLLLKVSDEAPRGLTIYGQEMDFATTALAKMNMILHGATGADIYKGNTLSSPHFAEGSQLKTFDFIVANPPFSNKNWTSGLNPESDEFDRFTWGIPPEKNGDYAFLLHIIKSLKSTGVGAVILPHGVLFRGNAEAHIRQNLIKQGYIKGIIGLPANLFYGTGIPACVIVIDKNTAESRAKGDAGLFMIDASRGYMKDGNKNRLRSQDIHKIVDVFNFQIALEGYSRMVELDEIIDNDYNLNIPRYIDASIDEDQHDLTAHLKGGIPVADIDSLESYWQVLPNLRQTLFSEMTHSRDGYRECPVASTEVKAAVLAHPEFIAFAEQSLTPFNDWWQAIYTEEHGDEEGLLADAATDKGSFTKSSVNARLKLATDSEEITALKQLLTYFDAEANAKKSLKEAQEALDKAVFEHYPTLDDAAIKTLLIEDKWHATLQGRIEDEIERITAQPANRIKELDERYAKPLSKIVDEVETLSQKVQAHLQAMGVA